MASPVRPRQKTRPKRNTSEIPKNIVAMKRRSSSTSFQTESSEEKDDTNADGHFDPRSQAAKRRKTGSRRSKVAPQKSQRTSKTPQTFTKAPKSSTTTTTPKGSTKKDRNSELSSAISANAHLPPCKLGAVEMVTFFPLHIRWPELGLRLYRNGWKSLSISKAMLHARDKLDYRSDDAVERRKSANRHQVLSNGKYFFQDGDFTPTSSEEMTPVTSYDVSTYTPRDNISTSSLFTAKLVDIAEGVKNFPKGEDRGVVTQAIEYAVRNQLDGLTTADIPQLAAQQGFQDPFDSFGSEWDQHAEERMEARIELTGNYRTKRFERAYENEESASGREVIRSTTSYTTTR